jgi:hypothetical protein
VDEDGAVPKSPGCCEININPVVTVKVAFILLHLILLILIPSRQADFSKSLLCEEEDQFRRRYTPAQWTSYQGRNETLARWEFRFDFHPIKNRTAVDAFRL